MHRPAEPELDHDVGARGGPSGFAMPEVDTDRRDSTLGFLMEVVRARPAGRRALSTLTALLFLAGAGMFTYPFFTDLYTEQVVQGRLEDEFASQFATDDLALGDLGGDWEATVAPGRALTRMVIPRIGVDTIVVEGTSPDALRAGAGHYPNTPLPGQDGNVAIAGHRTTYGKPLNRADELSPGDEVWLVTPVGDFRYVLPEAVDGWNANPLITSPKDWSVIAPTNQPSVTLTTCHPKGSAAKRLIVRAVLAESYPPARSGPGRSACRTEHHTVSTSSRSRANHGPAWSTRPPPTRRQRHQERARV